MCPALTLMDEDVYIHVGLGGCSIGKSRWSGLGWDINTENKTVERLEVVDDDGVKCV